MVNTVNEFQQWHLKLNEMIQLPEGFQLLDPFVAKKEKDYYHLRWKVLREPWGQLKGTERDDQEDVSMHRMILSPAGEVVACGRLQLNSAAEAQIRYMAVHPDYRGKNLGAIIIHELESMALDAGAEQMILQARENATGFYIACGYSVVIETFLLYGSIQHYLMQKSLVNG